MKSSLLSFAMLVAATVPAAADPEPAPPSARGAIGVDGVAILPVGDYGNAANLAIGALGRVELAVGPGFVTGRGGLIYNALKGDGSLLFVPLYGGFRVPIGPSGLYAAGELGATLMFASAGGASSNDTKLGLTASVGVRRGAIDARGGLFLPDAGNALGLMGSVGFDFAAL